ncbi:hypothetical protein COUCH_00615 [Couchioplanes caeruleus]|uniref:hypothetical protein n=1 Tax=Couchioplanes caeruleus TaxID=56438 RepID=UPI0020C0B6EC|nr:hypothetical protein [Couchioplanes caeruleus]UQU64903.1 hypothetical protein COUCH_00615 [Couchioplanes caeruleus]
MTDGPVMAEDPEAGGAPEIDGGPETVEDPILPVITGLTEVARGAVAKARFRGGRRVSDLHLFQELLEHTGVVDLLEALDVEVPELRRRVQLRSGFRPPITTDSPDGRMTAQPIVWNAFELAGEGARHAGRAAEAADVLEMLLHLPPGDAHLMLREARVNLAALTACRGDDALGVGKLSHVDHRHVGDMPFRRRMAWTTCHLPLLAVHTVLVAVSLIPATVLGGVFFRLAAVVVGAQAHTTASASLGWSRDLLLLRKSDDPAIRHALAHLLARTLMLLSAIVMLMPTAVQYAVLHEAPPMLFNALKIFWVQREGALGLLIMSLLDLPYREILLVWCGLAFAYAAVPPTSLLDLFRGALSTAPRRAGVTRRVLLAMVTPLWLLGRACDTLPRWTLVQRGVPLGPGCVLVPALCIAGWASLALYAA